MSAVGCLTTLQELPSTPLKQRRSGAGLTRIASSYDGDLCWSCRTSSGTDQLRPQPFKDLLTQPVASNLVLRRKRRAFFQNVMDDKLSTQASGLKWVHEDAASQVESPDGRIRVMKELTQNDVSFVTQNGEGSRLSIP